MAIILIFSIANTMIWAGNTSLSIVKYQRKFCAVETFSQSIPITHKKTLVFFRRSQPINILEIAYISDVEEDNKDKYDNFVILTGIHSFASPSFFSTKPFYQDLELVTPQAQKALDEDFRVDFPKLAMVVRSHE